MQQQLNSNSNSNILSCGAPHFRSIAKQHRHANYNLEKALNEWLDNVIKLATCIHITTEVDSEGRLQELKVSDNYISGFVNISEQGINNPFNMGHIKSGHDDDSETSEFGCGGKAAALSASNHMSVVTKVAGQCYKVVCDFIKMEREEDVFASYNPSKREISVDDYKEIHPFETGSSIVLSKMLGTICEQTTQKKLTERLKKGVSETYSKFLKKDVMEIYVNGEPVEQEIDFFLDPKCMPFTIKKSLFILEKAVTNDKIYLVQKIVDRATWQLYNKAEDKWETLGSAKEADAFRETKRIEGYTYICQQSSNIIDGSCLKMESTFVFYSDRVHTDEPFDHLLPQDQVLIYKDNRKYGKKSLVKHNNGINNYTLHKIEFTSKKIGKELGITFNKDITMECNNDLTMAIKSAIRDNRKEFNADTSTALNSKLCDKALKLGVVNLMTCPKNKLSKLHREKRELDERKACQKENPVFKKPSAPLKPTAPLKPSAPLKPATQVPSTPVKPIVVHVPVASSLNDDSSDYSSSDYSSSDESVSSKASSKSSDSKTSVDFSKDPITLVVEEVSETIIKNDPVISETIIKNDPVISETVISEVEQSKAILIRASKLIMDITASDDFNIKLDSSKQIADMIQKLMNL
jgi:hypothetical protein